MKKLFAVLLTLSTTIASGVAIHSEVHTHHSASVGKITKIQQNLEFKKGRHGELCDQQLNKVLLHAAFQENGRLIDVTTVAHHPYQASDFQIHWANNNNKHFDTIPEIEHFDSKNGILKLASPFNGSNPGDKLYLICKVDGSKALIDDSNLPHNQQIISAQLNPKDNAKYFDRYGRIKVELKNLTVGRYTKKDFDLYINGKKVKIGQLAYYYEKGKTTAEIITKDRLIKYGDQVSLDVFKMHKLFAVDLTPGFPELESVNSYRNWVFESETQSQYNKIEMHYTTPLFERFKITNQSFVVRVNGKVLNWHSLGDVYYEDTWTFGGKGSTTAILNFHEFKFNVADHVELQLKGSNQWMTCCNSFTS